MNTIEYKVKPYGVGRRYPHGKHNSYQGMYNVARRLVLDGKATSIDGKNMHPVILNQLVKSVTDRSFP